MAIWGADDFNVAADGSIAGRTANQGGTWVQNPAWSTGDVAAYASVGRVIVNNNWTLFHLSFVPPTADYSVEATLYSVVRPNSSSLIGVAGRVDAATGSCYSMTYDRDSSTWYLHRWSGPGVGVPIGSSFSDGIADGGNRVFKLVMTGSTIEGYVNGVLRCTATDPTYSLRGKAGIIGKSDSTWTATNGYHLDTFTADNVGAVPPPPNAPSSLVATAASGSQINLSWTDNATNEEKTEVERATAFAGPYTVIGEVGAGVNSFAATGLTPSTQYFFRVRAYNPGGYSAYSNIDDEFTQSVPTSNSVASKLQLDRTIYSIGYWLQYEGDNNETATCTVRYKRSSDPSYQAALPPWRHGNNVDGLGFGWAGSILKCDAGTSYDLEFTLTDADGVNASGLLAGVVNDVPVSPFSISTTGNVATITATVSTRAEPSFTIPTPTHYVRKNGNDAWDGTSATFVSGTTGPWATYSKAINSAPSGAKVQFGPGYFYAPPLTRSNPIELYAQFPVITNSPNSPSALTVETDKSKVTYLEGGIWSAPTGTAASPEYTVAPWLPRTYTRPVLGGTASGWYDWPNSWTGTNPLNAIMMSATRDELDYKRVAVWDRKAPGFTWSCTQAGHTGHTGWSLVATDSHFMELADNNGSYIGGGAQASGGVLMRDPQGVNPNSKWVLLSPTGSGLTLDNASNSRISGFALRATGANLLSNTHFFTFDHNFGLGCGVGATGWTGSSPDSMSADNVFRFNINEDHSLWEEDQTGISWDFIKGSLFLHDGTELDQNRIGARQETGAYGGVNGGFKRTDISFTKIGGFFNGIGFYNPNGDRTDSSNVDCHDLLFYELADDALEPEQQTTNFRAWNLRCNDLLVLFSSAPLDYTPVYIFDCEIYRIGTHGIAVTPLGQRQATPIVFKDSGNGNNRKRVFFFNNTFWTDIGYGRTILISGASWATSWYWRNNILRTSTGRPLDITGYTSAFWDEDYNFFGGSVTDSSGTFGLGAFQYNSTRYFSSLTSGANSLGAYRTASGRGANTNKVNGQDFNLTTGGQAQIDALLAAPLTGNLQQVGAFLTAGTNIPNVYPTGTVVMGSNYHGSSEYTPPPPVTPPQKLRPDGDINTNWTPVGAADRWDALNETAADNADYVQSPQGGGSAQEVSLTNAADPAVSTGHVVRYRYAKDATGGSQVNLTVGLYQGATLIASQVHNNISETPTDGSFTLSAAEADAITDYSDLRLRFTAVQV